MTNTTVPMSVANNHTIAIPNEGCFLDHRRRGIRSSPPWKDALIVNACGKRRRPIPYHNRKTRCLTCPPIALTFWLRQRGLPLTWICVVLRREIPIRWLAVVQVEVALHGPHAGLFGDHGYGVVD
jgi:hypothetical protein